MDWSIMLTLIGGASAVLLASLLIPGFTDLISQMLSFFSRLIFTMFGMIPKPLKILIFLVLFFSMGTYVTNLTIGATHMCYEDKGIDVDNYEQDVIYKIPFMRGLILNFWDVLKGDLISVNLILHEDNTYSNHAASVEREVGGVKYNVMTGLAPVSEIRGFSTTSKLSKDPPSRQWENIPGYDESNKQMIKYAICYDGATQTCVLDRGKIDGVQAKAGCGDGLTDGVKVWSNQVGFIYYEYNEGDVEQGVRNDYVLTFISPRMGTISFDGENSTMTVRSDWWRTFLGNIFGGDDNQVEPLYILWDTVEIIPATSVADCKTNPENDDFVASLRNVKVNMQYKEENPIEFVLYNSIPEDLLVARDCDDKFQEDSISRTVRCTDIQGSPGLLIFDTSDEVIQELKADVVKNLGEEDRLTYSRRNIVNFGCNSETDSPFDTKMLLLGVDVFNPKYMVFFVLFGVLLSFFAYLLKFR